MGHTLDEVAIDGIIHSHMIAAPIRTEMILHRGRSKGDRISIIPLSCVLYINNIYIINKRI